MRKLLLASVALIAMLPITAAARGRAGVFVGPGYARFGWYGWNGWYGPYGGWYPYGPYFATPNAGEVKFDTKVKDAEVFINGALAGTVGQLKTITMHPGTYEFEVRAPGRAPFKQKVFVVAGKTTKLHPDLGVETGTAPKG